MTRAVPWVVGSFAFMFVVVALVTTPLIVSYLSERFLNIESMGAFGDQFGATNALFSGLAFAAVVLTLWMQRRELELQREEMNETQDLMSHTIDIMTSEQHVNTYFAMLAHFNDYRRQAWMLQLDNPRLSGSSMNPEERRIRLLPLRSGGETRDLHGSQACYEIMRKIYDGLHMFSSNIEEFGRQYTEDKKGVLVVDEFFRLYEDMAWALDNYFQALYAATVQLHLAVTALGRLHSRSPETRNSASYQLAEALRSQLTKYELCVILIFTRSAHSAAVPTWQPDFKRVLEDYGAFTYLRESDLPAASLGYGVNIVRHGTTSRFS